MNGKLCGHITIIAKTQHKEEDKDATAKLPNRGKRFLPPLLPPPSLLYNLQRLPQTAYDIIIRYISLYSHDYYLLVHFKYYFLLKR